MSASSSPIIQTPPSAPLGPSSPEDRNLAKLSWVDEVEGYYNIDISRLSLLLTRSLHATLLVDLSTRCFLERGGSEFSYVGLGLGGLEVEIPEAKIGVWLK